MNKSGLKIILAIMVFLLLFVTLGCSQISDLTQVSSPKSTSIVRGTTLGGEWRMDQLIVNVGADDESLILLRLAYGDKVDGYFYVEKGKGISFQITGDSLVYESSAKEAGGSTQVDSDRFSFVASQTQGNTYTLTFRNPAQGQQTKVTAFLEVIYPIGGSLFIPIERN